MKSNSIECIIPLADLHMQRISFVYIVSSLIEIGPEVLEKEIYKFLQYIFAIS